MTSNEILPLAVMASSLLPGLIIFALPESRIRWRTALNLLGALAKLLLVGLLLAGVAAGEEYGFRYTVLPGIDLALKADALALLFVTLSALLWLFTTLYAIGYLERSPRRSRFFGFFSLCVTATMGIAMAGNLFTFFVFYELLTLTTFPLVVHRGTDKAMKGGTVYLAYTLGGGALLLTGIVWLHSLLGQIEFTHGGVLAALADVPTWQLQAIFLLMIAGVGVKAAIVPLHGWLPQAMVAPAPVSALLHAVAVVKAGAFGIIRIVYEVYGIEFAQSLDLLTPLAVMATVTILWGSFRALFQDDLKKRLAFSTVSQISYIVLGVALFGPIGTVGGLVHLVHQGLMKITLFFCAGNYAESAGHPQGQRNERRGAAHAFDHSCLQHWRAWHDGRTAHRRRGQQSLVDRRRHRGRHGLGCLGAVDLEPAQCRLFPAYPLARLAQAAARCLSERAHGDTRMARDGMAVADPAAVRCRCRAGRRHVFRYRLEPACLGATHRTTGVSAGDAMSSPQRIAWPGSGSGTPTGKG